MWKSKSKQHRAVTALWFPQLTDMLDFLCIETLHFFWGGIFNFMLWKRCCPYALVRFRKRLYFDLEYLLKYPVVSHLQMLKRTPELHSVYPTPVSSSQHIYSESVMAGTDLSISVVCRTFNYQHFILVTGLTAYSLMVMNECRERPRMMLDSRLELLSLSGPDRNDKFNVTVTSLDGVPNYIVTHHMYRHEKGERAGQRERSRLCATPYCQKNNKKKSNQTKHWVLLWV